MTGETLKYVSDAAHEFVQSLREDSARCPLNQTRVDAAIDRCLQQLTVVGPRGAENRLPSSKLWEIAGEILARGELQTRARTKPLGYAGDYIMLTQIYERYQCDDPCGRLFDHYFQALDAPEAVRQRIELAAAELQTHWRAIKGEDYRVIVIGAGPAIELELALQAGVRPAEVCLLDLDQPALDEAQRRLSAVGRWQPRIEARRENLYRLPGRSERVLPSNSADFLICLGLFDYLVDDQAIAHLKTYWNALRRGGRLLVGNFSIACQSRAYMEWIGNWYLLFRSPQDLLALATAAGIPAQSIDITVTANGVNLILRATKPCAI